MLCSLGIHMILPYLNKTMIDQGLMARNMAMVVRIIILNLVLVVSSQGFGILQTRYLIYVNSMVSYRLMSKAFKQALYIKVDYYDSTNPTEMMQKMMMDVNNITQILNNQVLTVISQIFRLVGGLVGLIVLDWKLTLIVLCIIPIRYKIINYMAKKRREIIERFMEDRREFSKWYGDSVNGVKEIRLWGIDWIKIWQFKEKQRKIITDTIKLRVMDKINMMTETLLFHFLTDALYIVGAVLIFNNSLTMGELFAFISYSSYVTSPISAILNLKYSFSKLFPAAKRLFEFLDEDKEKDFSNEDRISLTSEEIEGKIEYRNVGFSYDEDTQVLEDVSFQIDPKEKVAIVGTNGSGKSTILKLLLRFYKPDQGQIIMDDKDIFSLDLRSYRDAIAVVSQETYLFDTTVEENIKMFSDVSDQKFKEAVKSSRADEFVKKMKDGYQTLLGKNGARLSGGEKQKISMARAFTKDYQILILDEPTSNYDVQSEQFFGDLIEGKLKDKTVVIITHEPNLLRFVDKIIIIDEGKIRAVGSYQELLENKEYQKYFGNQNLQYEVV